MQSEVFYMRTVLFVCTGNTCRSPMAEGIFNTLAQERDIPVRAKSCGIAAVNGEPVTENAVRAAAEYGADISGHTACQITQELFDEAEAVYTMTRSHADMLRGIIGGDKIHTLSGRDISDPFGGDYDIYKAAAKEIYFSVNTLLDEFSR